VAGPIVSELTETDLRKLRAVAAHMRQVPSSAISDTFREFLDRSSSAVAVPRGGLPYLRRLSAGALGEERTRGIFDDGAGSASPLARLEVAPPDTVGALLADEPPQVAGAILARLDPRAAAAILTGMPPERQSIVMEHVSRMTELPAAVLEDMAAALANELPSSDASTLVSVDGVAKAAEILNAAGRDASTAVLTGIEANDIQLATQVRQAMFTFDDLRRVDARGMRDLLREVPTDRLTLALKGAPDEVRAAIFAGLSARAAELISDDLEVLGKVRKAEVDAARSEVLTVALRLEAEGKLDLGREGE
ncbi:MAG: FliG C-terminal domain-containing protein, partial [Polyangiaceae bacterium]